MWFDLVLLIVLSICLVTDLKARKIYNNVIFPSLILSFLLNFIFNGWSGIEASFVGFLTGLGILLIPYLLGGMGAGDVKLLALIGALKGATFVVTTAIYMALIGGFLALCIFLFRKGVMKRVKSISYSLYGYKYGLKIPLALDKDALKTSYPYGVAIAGGSVFSLFAKGWMIL